jgi:two-component system response regulator MprA
MPSSQKRILIVEDSHDIQILLAKLLKAEGYTVECADNGALALEFLRSTDEQPELILLDLMMPDMDGYQFRREQEKHEKTAGIPIVVMTADGDVQSKAMKIGAKGFLKKPFSDIELILETVGRFFPK